MIKIAFFCVMIAIGNIHCNSTNISNNTDLPTGLPIIAAKTIDINEQNQMKFLTSLNLSGIRTAQANNKPNDLSGYYSWLNFLKTSTTTQANNITFPA